MFDRLVPWFRIVTVYGTATPSRRMVLDVGTTVAIVGLGASVMGSVVLLTTDPPWMSWIRSVAGPATYDPVDVLNPPVQVEVPVGNTPSPAPHEMSAPPPGFCAEPWLMYAWSATLLALGPGFLSVVVNDTPGPPMRTELVLGVSDTIAGVLGTSVT